MTFLFDLALMPPYSTRACTCTCTKNTCTRAGVNVVYKVSKKTGKLGRSENVLKCLNVNTISLNSHMCNHARVRAV